MLHFDFCNFLHKLGPLIQNDEPARFLGIASWENGCDDASAPVVETRNISFGLDKIKTQIFRLPLLLNWKK